MNLDDRGPLCTCGHGHADHWEPTGADLPDERWPCLVVDCPCKDFTSAGKETAGGAE